MQADPRYIQRLQALPLIERQRLLEGDWGITPAGNVFRREWFQVALTAPAGLRTARFWDLAASTKTSADYTVGAKVGVSSDGRWYILDLVRGRWAWPDARRVIIATAQMDGPTCPQIIEDVAFQRAAFDDLLRQPELAGYQIKKQAPSGDKLNRALIWSSKAEGNLLWLVQGAWNMDFINEAVSFSGDGKTHDDQVDGVSGAVQALAAPRYAASAYTGMV